MIGSAWAGSNLLAPSLSKAVQEEDKIVLRSSWPVECVLEIPMPVGYPKLGPVLLSKLESSISACIDPKRNPDHDIAVKDLPFNVPQTQSEKAQAETTAYGHSNVFQFRDLLRTAEANLVPEAEAIRYSCWNNNEAPSYPDPHRGLIQCVFLREY